MSKMTKLSVKSSITKSYNYQSVSCELAAEFDIAADDKPAELYQQLYDKLTARCIGNVDRTIAAMKKAATATKEKELNIG